MHRQQLLVVVAVFALALLSTAMDLEEKLLEQYSNAKEPRLASLLAAQADMLKDLREYTRRQFTTTTVVDDHEEARDARCDVMSQTYRFEPPGRHS